MDEQKRVPIRVAQIMGKLWAGGVESVVFNYYREIDKKQVQFDFYYDADSTVEPPQELIDMGARFIKIPPYQDLFTYIKTLKHHFKENKYTIVHSHINTLSVFPLFVAWTTRVPIRIAHNHSVPGGNEFRRNLLKNVLRIFAKLFSTDYLACSEKAARWMFGDKTYEKGNVLIVKNAVDMQRFRPSEDIIESYKKNLDIENNFVVGHIGRFTYAKNHKFLLKIFIAISKRTEDAKLLLVGDGELHEDIVDEISKLGIQDKVILVGQVENPENYYKLCDVIVLPSVFEGLSLTTIESQIAGVPIVISEAVPNEAVISDGCTYCNLNDDATIWAETALNISKKKVELLKLSEEYDIHKRAKMLAKWYIEHN